jgi:adenylate cyclase
LKWGETVFIITFGMLVIWYLPRTDSRFATFIRSFRKGSAVLGITLNLLSLLSCVLLFKYGGLLVDAASIFIIGSAVMGSFFSTALLDDDAKRQRDEDRAQTHDGGKGAGKLIDSALARWKRIHRSPK